jgi:hypothetical protein
MYEEIKQNTDVIIEKISVNENLSMVQVGSETNRSPRDQRNHVFDEIIAVNTGVVQKCSE